MALWFTIIAGLGLCYAGMTGLALALDRHHRQLRGGDCPARLGMLLRAVSAALLLLALLSCIQYWGVGAGIAAWLGCLTVGAFLFIGLLPYAPRAATLLALVGGLAGLMAAGFS
ncbi:DUF3325 domain-containing protein [Rugamonas sp. CCM 8940]|uniref:DUF3325 domain-containing protein n=1 Tax=Rugamonas sp. CCM 8940 TaxID=2765359 RepID=UPI001F21038E|nr:DUF3325 domain-containing protein [Rugamonas sp. CCM 8940]